MGSNGLLGSVEVVQMCVTCEPNNHNSRWFTARARRLSAEVETSATSRPSQINPSSKSENQNCREWARKATKYPSRKAPIEHGVGNSGSAISVNTPLVRSKM
jgi:hypothetical protein